MEIEKRSSHLNLYLNKKEKQMLSELSALMGVAPSAVLRITMARLHNALTRYVAENKPTPEQRLYITDDLRFEIYNPLKHDALSAVRAVPGGVLLPGHVHRWLRQLVKASGRPEDEVLADLIKFGVEYANIAPIKRSTDKYALLDELRRRFKL